MVNECAFNLHFYQLIFECAENVQSSLGSELSHQKQPKKKTKYINEKSTEQ